MTASIWNPSISSSSQMMANNTYQAQRYVVSILGQTVFILTQFSYIPATGSLLVEINGVGQYLGIDFLETNGVTVTLTSGLMIGDVVVIRGLVGITGAAGNAALAAMAAIQLLNVPNLPLAVIVGGTGATTAAGAKVNLGFVSQTDVIPIATGGTGQTTKAAAFLALAPVPVKGKAVVSLDGTSYSTKSLAVPSMTVFNTAGTFTWTPPAGTTSVQIELSDGGSSSATSTGANTRGGRGGNSSISVIAVNDAVTYTITVGIGGVGGGAATNVASVAGGVTSVAGSGITTLLSSNGQINIPGGESMLIESTPSATYGGGSSLYSPEARTTNTGSGAGGIGSAQNAASNPGNPGIVVIRY